MSRNVHIFRSIDNVVQGRVGSKTSFRKGAAESKGTNELQRPAYCAACTYIHPDRVFSHDATAAMLGGKGKLEISIGLGMFGTALPA